MPKQHEEFTENDLVSMICGDAKTRDVALHYIFAYSGWYNKALINLRFKGFNEHDAKDAFQDALIILDRNIRNGEFDNTKSLKKYFIGICTGCAKSNKRKKQRIAEEEEIPEMVQANTPETEYLKKEEQEKVWRILKKLDPTCIELLKLYMLTFSMKEIKDALNIVSDGMTRKLAYECRKKFGDLYDNDTEYLK